MKLRSRLCFSYLLALGFVIIFGIFLYVFENLDKSDNRKAIQGAEDNTNWADWDIYLGWHSSKTHFYNAIH